MQCKSLQIILLYILTPEDSGSEYGNCLNLPAGAGLIKACFWFLMAVMLSLGISRLC